MSTDHDTKQYLAIKNDDGQYSLWPATKPIPSGWRPTAIQGDAETCKKLVDQEWRDMRPAHMVPN